MKRILEKITSGSTEDLEDSTTPADTPVAAKLIAE